MRRLLILAWILWGVVSGAAARPSDDGNFIRVVVPERDTTVIAARFQRFNASTLPGSKVTINGETFKVWPTGAFAGYLPLKPGINRLEIVSEHPGKGIVRKVVVVESRLPVAEKTTERFSIERAETVPAEPLWLQTGDLLQVRMKAFPGCRAYFLNGQPMQELPSSQTGGIAGIYQGMYRINPGDTLRNEPVPFTLVGGNGEKTTAASAGRVSLNAREFPAVGVTTGTFPYFSYGLGEDRLGGARISYLDTGVVLPLSGRTGNLYRVNLGSSRQVFIPSELVRVLPTGTFPPQSLTGSWTVTGDDRQDYLRIGLSQKLPYITRYESHPSRIVVELFGATSNTNWITQLNSAREIGDVWHEQPETGVMRITIGLKHPRAWGYRVYYERNTLVVMVKRPPATGGLQGLTIGLDAGHGGPNNGALGSTGAKEKEINLAVVMKLKAALEREGARVILTRKGDENINNTDRWLIWQQADPHLALSIHCNSIGNSDPLRTQGVSTYYKYVAFRTLSAILYEELLQTGLEEFGNIGSFNFLLNAPTQFPNALLELAFMSHPEDEMKLLDPAFQDKIVTAVVAGLEKYMAGIN
ncbi:MAG: N-acetylmuramoyl-L-alanine amidase [Prolixibacteraceae bacterium]|jgi:N-acetylmuramoyl-L-alanine amidase|nr:N-acetylmuramoyl-L-alanine amidase [Prolixibacteraceae bacterium]